MPFTKPLGTDINCSKHVPIIVLLARGSLEKILEHRKNDVIILLPELFKLEVIIEYFIKNYDNIFTHRLSFPLQTVFTVLFLLFQGFLSSYKIESSHKSGIRPSKVFENNLFVNVQKTIAYSLFP